MNSSAEVLAGYANDSRHDFQKTFPKAIYVAISAGKTGSGYIWFQRPVIFHQSYEGMIPEYPTAAHRRSGLRLERIVE